MIQRYDTRFILFLMSPPGMFHYSSDFILLSWLRKNIVFGPLYCLKYQFCNQCHHIYQIIFIANESLLKSRLTYLPLIKLSPSIIKIVQFRFKLIKFFNPFSFDLSFFFLNLCIISILFNTVALFVEGIS